MRRGVIIGGVVLSVLAVAGFVALVLAPQLTRFIDYRALVIAQIEAATGRQATINGPVTMRMQPTPVIVAEDVHVANLPGAPSVDVIHARRAVFHIEPSSLVSHKLHVTELDLEQPEIHLDVLADGSRSWDFQPTKHPDRTLRHLITGFRAERATIVCSNSRGAVTLTGDFSFDGAGAVPKVEADLAAGSVDADALLPPRDAGPDMAHNGGPRWSAQHFDLTGLRGIDARIVLKADQLRYRRYAFDKPALAVTLHDGTLRLDNLSAGLLGGHALITGSVAARDVPVFKLDISLKNASLQQVLGSWADSPFASGVLSMTGSFSGSGTTEQAVIASLSGTAMLDASNGTVRGFDVPRLSGGMQHLDHIGDFIDLADTAMNGGETRYSRMGGNVAITKGVARLENAGADLKGAEARAGGTVDLPRWSVDMDLSLKLSAPKLADAPPVGLILSGPLDAPRRKKELADMGKFLGKKLVKTAVRDFLHPEDGPPDNADHEARRQATQRVINKLLDKLHHHHDRSEDQPDDGGE